MTKRTPPPLYEKVTDESRIATIPWTLFFNSMYNGDTGTSWTPTFVSLTSVGTPTFTGKYYKISQNLVYFTITVTPATNTSSVSGTTYVDNFPLDIFGHGACLAVGSNTGTSAGMCNASTKRIYTPTWTTVAVPVTVVGMVEAR